jgi:alkanesulfonate monooxygenase SsuD/methylene tetrahydromethanopterin reductase-like flavin-dependent oxidoreductase (luciferase family)
VTLRLVAEYADMNNVGGTPEAVRQKDELLLEHCRAIGRDPTTIERSCGVGTVFIRDTEAEARQAFEAAFAANGGARPWTGQPVGTPEQVTAHLAGYVEAGYRHLIVGFPPPHDAESMERLIAEVRPRLEAIG